MYVFDFRDNGIKLRFPLLLYFYNLTSHWFDSFKNC